MGTQKRNPTPYPRAQTERRRIQRAEDLKERIGTHFHVGVKRWEIQGWTIPCEKEKEGMLLRQIIANRGHDRMFFSPEANAVRS